MIIIVNCTVVLHAISSISSPSPELRNGPNTVATVVVAIVVARHVLIAYHIRLVGDESLSIQMQALANRKPQLLGNVTTACRHAYTCRYLVSSFFPHFVNVNDHI